MSPLATLLAFAAVLVALTAGPLAWVLFGVATLVQLMASAAAAARAAKAQESAESALRLRPNELDEPEEQA